ncbi:MAG TPA: hypothetical protein VIL34_07870 [Actinopolymorphaceae bacterium]|jgi:hypothetical protein
MIQKLCEFVRTRLDPQERALLAMLLAPSLAQVYSHEGPESGVAATEWSTSRLPEALAAAVREADLPRAWHISEDQP